MQQSSVGSLATTNYNQQESDIWRPHYHNVIRLHLYMPCFPTKNPCWIRTTKYIKYSEQRHWSSCSLTIVSTLKLPAYSSFCLSFKSRSALLDDSTVKMEFLWTQITATANDQRLLHDLVSSPISQHSVWSEITSHNSLRWSVTKCEQFIALHVGPSWP